MVLFDILKIKRYFILSICWTAGILIGGASMIYLFTIPDVTKLAALQVSQVYTLTSFGIMFFSANVGAAVGLFMKEVVLRDFIKGDSVDNGQKGKI
jgi:hypothetical protein